MFVLNVLFVLFCATSIRGSDESRCETTDSACTTKSSNSFYSTLVSGEEGSWDSSDPLTVEAMNIETETISLNYTEASLSGLKGCTVELASVDGDKFSWYLACTELIEKTKYVIDGSIGDMAVVGEGSCTVTRNSYTIQFDGSYETITGDDGESYMDVKSYDVAYVPNGKIVYDCDGLSEEVLDYFNENYEAVDQAVCQKGTTKFMAIFMENVNKCLSVESMSVVLNV